MAGSGSENSNDDVRAALGALGEIKRKSCVSELGLLAHIGHGEVEIGNERARGASELLGWPDSFVTLTANDEGTRYLSAIGRDVEFEERALHFDPKTRQLTLGPLEDRKQAANRTAAQKVEDAVRGGPLTITETHAALHAAGITNKEAKGAAIAKAVDLHLVHRIPNPRNANSTLVVLGPWSG